MPPFTQRQTSFLTALGGLSQYQGRSHEEIFGNLTDVFKSGDSTRINSFVTAIGGSISQYQGRSPQEVLGNINEVFSPEQADVVGAPPPMAEPPSAPEGFQGAPLPAPGPEFQGPPESVTTTTGIPEPEVLPATTPTPGIQPEIDDLKPVLPAAQIAPPIPEPVPEVVPPPPPPPPTEPGLMPEAPPVPEFAVPEAPAVTTAAPGTLEEQVNTVRKEKSELAKSDTRIENFLEKIGQDPEAKKEQGVIPDIKIDYAQELVPPGEEHKNKYKGFLANPPTIQTPEGAEREADALAELSEFDKERLSFATAPVTKDEQAIVKFQDLKQLWTDEWIAEKGQPETPEQALEAKLHANKKALDYATGKEVPWAKKGDIGWKIYQMAETPALKVLDGLSFGAIKRLQSSLSDVDKYFMTMDSEVKTHLEETGEYQKALNVYNSILGFTTELGASLVSMGAVAKGLQITKGLAKIGLDVKKGTRAHATAQRILSKTPRTVKRAIETGTFFASLNLAESIADPDREFEVTSLALSFLTGVTMAGATKLSGLEKTIQKSQWYQGKLKQIKGTDRQKFIDVFSGEMAYNKKALYERAIASGLMAGAAVALIDGVDLALKGRSMEDLSPEEMRGFLLNVGTMMAFHGVGEFRKVWASEPVAGLSDARRILDVSETATEVEIKSAYRRMALKFHPDKPGGSKEQMHRISEAKDILSRDAGTPINEILADFEAQFKGETALLNRIAENYRVARQPAKILTRDLDLLSAEERLLAEDQQGKLVKIYKEAKIEPLPQGEQLPKYWQAQREAAKIRAKEEAAKPPEETFPFIEGPAEEAIRKGEIPFPFPERRPTAPKRELKVPEPKVPAVPERKVDLKIIGLETATDFYKMSPEDQKVVRGQLNEAALKEIEEAKPIDEVPKVAQPAPPEKVKTEIPEGAVDLDPSQAQREAENYKKAHIRRDGMDVSIENPAGSDRPWIGPDGKKRKSVMNHDYGYIKDTKGFDKDHMDIVIKPGSPEGGPVFVVNQITPETGKFDEHKVMVGFETAEEAKKAYLSNYQKGWGGFGSIVPMDMVSFKNWVYSSDPVKGELKLTKKQKFETQVRLRQLAAEPAPIGPPVEETQRAQAVRLEKEREIEEAERIERPPPAAPPVAAQADQWDTLDEATKIQAARSAGFSKALATRFAGEKWKDLELGVKKPILEKLEGITAKKKQAAEVEAGQRLFNEFFSQAKEISESRETTMAQDAWGFVRNNLNRAAITTEIKEKIQNKKGNLAGIVASFPKGRQEVKGITGIMGLDVVRKEFNDRWETGYNEEDFIQLFSDGQKAAQTEGALAPTTDLATEMVRLVQLKRRLTPEEETFMLAFNRGLHPEDVGPFGEFRGPAYARAEKEIPFREIPASEVKKTKGATYRGTTSMAGTFFLGKGLYTTKEISKAKMYGKVVGVVGGMPDNPLILKPQENFTDWLLRESGEKNIREFNKKYPDPAEFVMSKGFDGVINDLDQEIVKYPIRPDIQHFKGVSEAVPGAAPQAVPELGEEFLSQLPDPIRNKTVLDVNDKFVWTDTEGNEHSELLSTGQYGERGAFWQEPDGTYHFTIRPGMPLDLTGRTMGHEILGHLGMITAMDSDPIIKKEFDRLYKIDKNSPWTKRLKERYQQDYDRVLAADGKAAAEKMIMQEWIAARYDDFADKKLKGQQQNIARRIYNLIREYIKKLMRKLAGKRKPTEQEIDDVIEKALGSLKSARLQAVTPEAPARALAPIAPEFFSPTQKLVEGLQQKKWGTGAQAWAQIQNAPGAKKAEMDWMGLEEFLIEKKGKVAKDEILAFVKANSVQMETVFQGEEEADIDDLAAQEEDIEGKKFEQYTEPGGKDYRELLLTLPFTPTEKFDPDKVKIIRRRLSTTQGSFDIEYEGAIIGEFGDDIKLVDGEHVGKSDSAIIRIAKTIFERDYVSREGKFISGHFDPANIMAHIRIKTRTNSKGEKILFLEEIQSDWSIEARKKGVEKSKILLKNKADLEKEYSGIKDKSSIEATGVQDRINWINKELAETPPDFPIRKNWEEVVLKKMLRYAAENGFDRMAWVSGEQTTARYKLSEKVDKLTWNPKTKVLIGFKNKSSVLSRGDVESGHLEGLIGKSPAEKLIAKKPEKKGNFYVAKIDEPFTPEMSWGVFEPGKRSPVESFMKEAAARVYTEERNEDADVVKEISGIDVDVGGEWAKNLYDRKIPNFLKKYGKKWGAQPEVAEVGFGEIVEEDYQGPEYTADQLLEKSEQARQDEKIFIARQLANMARKMRLRGATFKESVAAMPKSILEYLGGRRAIIPDEKKQLSIPITDAMKTEVMEIGQPLFAREKELPQEEMFPVERELVIGKEAIRPTKEQLKTEDIPEGDIFFKSENVQQESLLFSRAPKLQQELMGKDLFQTFSMPSEGVIERIQRRVQDSFVRLKTAQKAIEKETGKELPEEIDTYLDQELYTAVTKNKLNEFDRKHLKPLQKYLADTKLDLYDLGLYLYAQHAPDRNAHIKEINELFREQNVPGSGMSNKVAAEIIKKFNEEGKSDVLETAAQMVYKVTAENRKRMVENGLETADRIKGWEQAFGDKYVPLKGFEVEPTDWDPGSQSFSGGRGFDVRGKVKSAAGRESRANIQNLVTQVFVDSELKIVEAEKNKVANTFLDLVRANPNEDVWVIDEAKYMPRFDKKTGEVTYALDPRAVLAKNVLSVKVDGKEYHVTMKDEGMARAMKNLGSETMPKFVQMAASLTRTMSVLNTMFNPEFVLSNLAKDVQAAAMNISSENSWKMARQTVKDIPKAIAGSYRGMEGNYDSEWGKVYKEYSEHGGKIDFLGMEDVEIRQRRIVREISRLKGKGSPIKMFQAVFGYFERANHAVENGTRLAFYKNLRDNGVSPKRAASMAKNITVNFNKKGEMGPYFNAAYMFGNASIQGNARLAVVMKSKRMQKIAGGIIVGSALMAELMRLYGGDDEDGENRYDKIPDYVKETNWVLLWPKDWGGGYAKIPLPYGYNVFHAAGVHLSGAAFHGKSPIKAGLGIAKSAVSAFNPFGTAPTVVQNLTPTIGRWAADLGFNKNFYGAPIKKAQFPFGPKKPDSQLHFRTVSDASRNVTEYLNRISGGGKFDSGYLDFNPEAIDYFFKYFSGGAGAFVMRSANLAGKAIAGELPTPGEIPITRRFYREDDPYYTSRKFRERIEKLEKIKKQVKHNAENESEKVQKKYLEKVKKYVPLMPALSKKKGSLRSGLTQNYKDIRALEEGDFTDEQKKYLLKKTKAKSINDVIKKLETESENKQVFFNKLWNKQIGKD